MTDQPTPLDEVIAGLADDGVYVAPAMADQVDAAEEAAIVEAVGRLDTPLKVVVVPLDDGDMFGGRASDLLARVHDRTGEDGWYLAPAYLFSDGAYSLESAAWGVDTGFSTRLLGYEELDVAEELHPTDLGAGLVELTTALADGTIDERVAEASTVAEERYDDATSGGAGPDEDGMGTGTIVALVLGTLVVVGALLAWLNRPATRAVVGGTRRVYTLPPSVVDRVRRADAARLARRADQEVLALGELIEQQEIGAATDAWQSALDHYDAARRLLTRATADGTPGPTTELLDVVGAIVLAQRGADALSAAQDGKAHEPRRTCFLNPLHGAATASRTLDHGGERAKVPVCQECRRDLGAGRTPDVLDVLRDGEPVHYFEAGVEPWASTGFGALETDLVTELHRTRPRGA